MIGGTSTFIAKNDLSNEIFYAVEQSRIEALGSNLFKGIKSNILKKHNFDIKNNKEAIAAKSVKALEILQCPQCGGNGYMKSTPSCYHTCLECLGRGIMVEKEFN